MEQVIAGNHIEGGDIQKDKIAHDEHKYTVNDEHRIRGCTCIKHKSRGQPENNKQKNEYSVTEFRLKYFHNMMVIGLIP